MEKIDINSLFREVESIPHKFFLQHSTNWNIDQVYCSNSQPVELQHNMAVLLNSSNNPDGAVTTHII